MAKRVKLTLFAALGMAAVFSSPTSTAQAHHDAASAYIEIDRVEHLMELAYRSCFGHGDDLDALRGEAKAHGWKTAADKELKRNESAVSEMIGGWIFTNSFGSFAVMQSKFKEGPSAYLCSITAKLPFDRHDQVKASFERRFSAALAREADRSGKHTDQFSMTSPRKSPIEPSIVWSRGGVTINMVHGPKSGEAAVLPLLRGAASGYRPTADDQIDHLMELTYQSCFSRGADEAALRAEALTRGWNTVPETELLRHETERSRMIGGWTFRDAFGGGAVIHSVSKDDPPIYRCSITAQVASGQHDRVTEAFERRFATRLSEEIDAPHQHIDRFWAVGPRRTTVHATLLYVPSKHALTIWLAHGRDRRRLRERGV